MAQTIKLKRSATQNAVPSTSSLALGEIALNTYDGKLFIKKDVGGTESIVTIGAVGAGSIGPTELASTTVTAGSYGSTSAIPVITIDADGRITSASTATISGLSANSVTSTEIAANAVGISELNVTDGTDGQVLTTDGSGTLTFEDQSGGAASANAFATNIANGNGSTATFTLSSTPSAESKIIAFINGVFQNQDAYTISGTDITFDTAPISGTNNVVVYVIGDVYSGESVLISNFDGDSSTTAFTLSNNPGNENNTQVYIDGVYQQKTTYSVSGTTLTFSSAPPTGTANIEVVMLTSTTVNTPAAGSVVTASMADDSVTGAKIVSSAVTTAKIADANVTTAKIADANITTAKIADDAVTIGKIADAALVIESEGISSNDNDTTLPTSAAVKDYVDGKDFETGLAGDSGTGTVNTSQTLTVSGTTNEVNTSVSGQTVTVGLPDSVSLTSNLTVGGYIAGPSSFTIDPAGVGDNTGTVVIAGNLQVDGTQTTINSTSMSVDDLNLTLASGAANAAAANGAGLTIDGASATLLYASSGDKFVFNKTVDATIGTAAQPNITSVGTLTSLTTSNIASSGYLQLTTNDVDFIVRDTTDNPTNFIWRDHSGSKLYLGSPAAEVTIRSDAIIDTGYKVGIGTSSPSTALEVKGDGTSIQVSSADYDVALLGRRGSSGVDLDKGYMRLKDTGTTKVAIDSAGDSYFNGGDVGIGTTSPSFASGSGLEIERAGIATIRLQNSNGKSLEMTQDADFTITSQNSSSNILLMPTGNVGIGISSPLQKLHVNGHILLGDNTTDASYFVHSGTSITLSADTDVGIVADANDTSGEAPAGVIAFGAGSLTNTDGNQDFTEDEFGNSGLPRLEYGRFHSNGYFGIGTNSPTNIIHTKTSSNNVGRFESTDATAFIQINDTADSFYLNTGSQIGSIGGNAGVNAGNLNIDLTNGNVGIGTSSPTEKLEVDGGLKISNSNSRLYFGTEGGTSYRALEGNTSGSLLQVGEGYTDIALQGNVGIGTSSPATGLHVVTGGGTTPFRVQGGANSGVNIMEVGFAGGGAGANFIVDDNGQVGIGTDTPKAKLHVQGDAFIGEYNGYETEMPSNSATLHIHEKASGSGVALGDETHVVISTGATSTGAQGYQGSLWFGTSDHPAGGSATNSTGTQFVWRNAGIASGTDADTGAGTGHGNLEFYTNNGGSSGTKRLAIERYGNIETALGVPFHAATGRTGGVNITTSYTNVLNMSSLGSGGARGFYLVTVVRQGGSVGTAIIMLIGTSSTGNSYIYDTLISNSLQAQMSGSWLQIKISSGTAAVHATAVPIGLTGVGG